MRIEPLDACFGAVVTGFDLRLLSESTLPSIHEAWLEFGLLVFPGQHLDRSEQDNAARHFGDLEFTATALTNVRRDGSVRADPLHSLNKSLKGNESWHHDSTYMPVQAKGALFTAEVVTTSGGAAMQTQQKMMAVMMPIIFGFVFYQMPSGLVLYWLTNTLIMSAYQLRLKNMTLA